MKVWLRVLIVIAAVILFAGIGVGIGMVLQPDPKLKGDCSLSSGSPTSGFVDGQGCPVTRDAYKKYSDENSSPKLLRIGSVLGMAIVGGVGATILTGIPGRRREHDAY